MNVYGSNKYIPGYQQNWYARNLNGYQSPYAGQAGLKGLAQYDQQFGDLAAKNQVAGAGSGMASSGSEAGSASGGESGGGGIGYGAIGSIASGVFNALPNWYDIQHQGQSRNVTKAIYGDSSQDPIARLLTGHGSDMYAARNEISSNEIDYSGNKNNDNLLNSWDSNDLQDVVDYEFGWSNIADNLTASGKGAAAGMSIGGPWGALIGGIAGGLLNIGSQIGGNSRAEELINAIKRANREQTDNFYTTAKNNQQRQQRDWFMHTPYNYKHAEGGSLDELNGVTKFNVGGSHSENPYEGIQQGIASDGNPNLVEEGEVKYKDYIYSARLKPSKSMLKEFNLPEKYAGKTFAELADILQKESADRPNDPISTQTLEDWMSRLASAQEEYKAKQAERKLAKAVDNMSTEEKAALMSSLVQPMAQQEGIDLGQPMYASGGKIHIKPENRGKFTALKKRTGKSATWFKQHGTPAQKKMATFALNARKWKHEDGGHLANNGLYLDLAVDYPNHPDWSLMSTGIGKDSVLMRRVNPPTYVPVNDADLALSVGRAGIGSPRTDFDSFNNYLKVQNLLNSDLGVTVGDYQAQLKPGFNAPLLIEDSKAPLGVKIATANNTKGTSTTGGFDGSMLRYAPVLGSAEAMLRSALQPKDFTVGNEYRQLSSQLRPIAAPHIGGYRRYNPYDINLGDIENIALTANALAANRGQNRATQGALNAAVINAAQKTAAARNLAAQQANEANRLAVDTYNLGIDQFNANRDTQYDQLNQQILQNKLNMLMSAAQADDASKEAWANMYNTTRENFFNQLGNVGRDEWNRYQFLQWLKQHPATARAWGYEG